MKEPLEFTYREKFLINYYRDRKLAKNDFERAGQFGYLFASLGFVGMYFWNGEIPWLLVGYFLLLYRVGHTLWSNSKYSLALANIIEKYEARIAELESNQKVSP